MSREPITIANRQIKPGERVAVDVELPKLSSQTDIKMPVHVIHGRREGPVLFISATLHGDELNGVEIVRRVLATKALSGLRGTLIAVPVVNTYGLVQMSRYLPDGRDLNRSFPGSGRGSLAARLANVFLEEIVSKCSHGIDLHTGSRHRTNLPQIRASLTGDETRELAMSFGVPVVLNAPEREGSLRASASEMGITTLLYEAGEALRYDTVAIRAGVAGILNIMRKLGMLSGTSKRKPIQNTPYVASSSSWIRAPESGLLVSSTRLGASVEEGQVLGTIHDPGIGEQCAVTARHAGLVVGNLQLPLVHEGDALFHIARFDDESDSIIDSLEEFRDRFS